MKDIDRLRELLNRPPVPDNLAVQLHADWEQQLGRRMTRRIPRGRRTAAAIAAGLFAVLFWWGGGSRPPAIIAAAYADLNKDRSMHNGLVREQRNWLKQWGIGVPPPMTVEMSKYCYLAGNKTVHLRLAGRAGETVNLFFYEGDLLSRRENKDRGSEGGLRWQVLKPRPDLTVLVLYSQGMSPRQVQRLLRAMLGAAAGQRA